MVEPSALDWTTWSWSVGPMPLRKSSLGVPKAPAERMTRPLMEVKFTVPSRPPLFVGTTLRLTACPPIRLILSTLVLSHMWKLDRPFAVTR